MNTEQKTGVFSYSYSAKQKEEILKIREKYVPKQPDNMTRLLQMDEAVTRKATTAALSVGIISSLVMGLGMSCCLVWTADWLLIGILIGLAGIAGVTLTYPLYRRVIQKEREKIAPEIIRLTDELLK